MPPSRSWCTAQRCAVGGELSRSLTPLAAVISHASFTDCVLTAANVKINGTKVHDLMYDPQYRGAFTFGEQVFDFVFDQPEQPPPSSRPSPPARSVVATVQPGVADATVRRG